MRLSARARADLAALRYHYRLKDRPEAIRNLKAAMRQAVDKIQHGQSLPAPRPYPDLRADGEAWVQAGPYWVLHTTTAPLTIVAVFYDSADIPGRS